MSTNPQREPTVRRERLDEDWFHLFALHPMVSQMRSEAAYQNNGHTGLTLLKNDHLRVVLEAAMNGSHIGEHVIDGASFVYVLEGSLRLECGDETRIAHSGEMVVVPSDRVRDLWAEEESSFLLVLAPDGSES